MSRAVRVAGQKDGSAGGGVGAIDTGVRTDESVLGSGDDEIAAASQDVLRFPEHDAAVGVLLGPNAERFNGTFCLGDDLVRHD